MWITLLKALTRASVIVGACAGNRYQIANAAAYRRSMTQWTRRGRLLVPESDADVAREQYENDQARDTYTYYGLAMYMAQVFEHEVVNLLVLAQIAEDQESAERMLTDPWEPRFRQTLGQLFQHLKPFLANDQQLIDDIAEGVRIRNRLAHAYWRERAEDAASVTGRAEIIGELLGIRDTFADLDERLTRISS